MASKMTPAEKRAYLRGLSKKVKPLVEAGDYDTVNEALTELYKAENAEITEFKTFHEWRKSGMKIKTDETAFLVWGSKRKTKQAKEEEEQTEEDKKYSFFPLCYLFANTQVEPFKRA